MSRSLPVAGDTRLAVEDPPANRIIAAPDRDPAPRTAATAAVKLDVRHVRRVFAVGRGDPIVALDNVSLEVQPGEFVAVLGPSGCGKSTLLQIMAGLLPASAGAVTLDGTSIAAPPPNLIYLFQQYSKSLFPWRSVGGNVAFALRGRGIARSARRAQALEYLKIVGLDGSADRYPWQLSGGMQQRVAIARALAAEPEVLLLDERSAPSTR
jgi:NitT/TauT family transport system ATP-binding protein